MDQVSDTSFKFRWVWLLRMLFERHDEIQHFSVFEVKSTSLQSRVFMKIYVSTYGWVFLVKSTTLSLLVHAYALT